jgi:hypothetical protein
MFAVNAEPDPLTHVSLLNRKTRSRLGGPGPSGDGDVAGGKRSEGGLQIVVLDDDPSARRDPPVRVEAEAFAEATGRFKAVGANDASGNKALEIPLDSGKGVGHALYEVDVESAGSYELTARVYWRDGCSNSLGFTIRGQKGTVASELFDCWHDLRCRKSFRLPAGRSTLKVRNLEDGVRLDYMELRKR